MSLPGETEAGSAGTQSSRGIAWRAHRDDKRSAATSLPRSSRDHIGTADPDALKIPARRANTHQRRAPSLHFTLNQRSADEAANRRAALGGPSEFGDAKGQARPPRAGFFTNSRDAQIKRLSGSARHDAAYASLSKGLSLWSTYWCKWLRRARVSRAPCGPPSFRGFRWGGSLSCC
jgi:hypothetical protein